MSKNTFWHNITKDIYNEPTLAEFVETVEHGDTIQFSRAGNALLFDMTEVTVDDDFYFVCEEFEQAFKECHKEPFQPDPVNPTSKGYYLTKTEQSKYGVAYWNGFKFMADTNQDGKLLFGIKRSFIISWWRLP